MSNFEDNTISKEAESGAVFIIDPAEEKLIVRKLDRVILPLMALVYFFQCIFKRILLNLRPRANESRSRQAEHQLRFRIRIIERFASFWITVLLEHFTLLFWTVSF